MYLKKELYELIRTDESIFDFIQESALDGLWYRDLENPENEWMNTKFWTVLGYNAEEMHHKLLPGFATGINGGLPLYRD